MRTSGTTKIIPAFNKKHPDIKVQFKADPPTEYNAALNARLAGGTAGDIITCRPFDTSLDLFKKGNLISVNDVKGIENFSDVAKSAWSTDDGKTTFCMPMASVIHGFVYNKEIFDELKLTPPKTVAEFHAVLDKIKADGKYTPLAMGTADQWEAATMGFQNIGVNYWKGEEGRKALIDGKQKFTDPAYVDTFKELATWAPYMGDGYKAQKYPDTQNLFTLGRAAIYPAGSWDMPIFRKQADFEFDAFAPPVAKAGDKCYISDHTDIAIGINAKSKNAEAAKTFLSWVASPEFAEIYANALPGFFPLSNAKVEVEGSGGGQVRRLARHLRKLDPQLLPDPGPRHAEPRERALERERPGDERQHEAGRGGQEGRGRPRQLVRAAQEVSFS